MALLSVSGTEAGCGQDGRGIGVCFQEGQSFLYSTGKSRPAMVSSYHPTGGVHVGAGAEAKNVWIYTPSPPHVS